MSPSLDGVVVFRFENDDEKKADVIGSSRDVTTLVFLTSLEIAACRPAVAPTAKLESRDLSRHLQYQFPTAFVVGRHAGWKSFSRDGSKLC